MKTRNRFPFPHTKLDVFAVAVRMTQQAAKVAASIPRGHRNVADHLRRSADNTVLLTSEGINRYNAAGKRQRYSEARGEAGEVAAAASLCEAHGWGCREQLETLQQLAGRVGAMLTKMGAAPALNIQAARFSSAPSPDFDTSTVRPRNS